MFKFVDVDAPFESFSRDILILMRHHTSNCPSDFNCAKKIKSPMRQLFAASRTDEFCRIFRESKKGFEILDFGRFSEVYRV